MNIFSIREITFIIRKANFLETIFRQKKFWLEKPFYASDCQFLGKRPQSGRKSRKSIFERSKSAFIFDPKPNIAVNAHL